MKKETYVQYAIDSHLGRPKPPYKASGKPRLWASDMNKCARKAFIRVANLAKPETEPDSRMRLYFQAGNMWEDDTLKSMQWHYGEQLTDQLNLKNKHWSGKCDFALYHNDESRQTVLIEHKSKGQKWWNYRDSLPQEDHIGQLYIYHHLYKEIYGSEPKLVLFYRSWGQWAEFYIEPYDDYVQIHGWLDGKAISKRMSMPLHERRRDMEEAIENGEIPPRQLDKSQGCTFRDKPSCPYYNYCWDGYEEQEPEEPKIYF